jgi:hypothetical protein
MNSKIVSSIFNELKNENQIFLNYLKAKFPIFHNSIFFTKDFQYGIITFLEKKGTYISLEQAEKLAQLLSEFYVNQGIFIKISNNTWKLNYLDFVTAKPGDQFSF